MFLNLRAYSVTGFSASPFVYKYNANILLMAAGIREEFDYRTFKIAGGGFRLE